ncbi:CHAT domain-containing protein [Pseudanabaena sp. ABRG5-3]|uniref:CHAT domain-containing protein n=1 Tax=Pseudanabaena sp. ABRG5-3 TaxID=685565 RepID=UPI000DC736DA|nr:tetratricopeptide repeat protein [Pseudanabaena sp. ABRG5-3]BBC26667.1 tetratricopeptide [Pseudanabaena sp. ABRG5-3]
MASRFYALMVAALAGILGMVSPPDVALMTAQAQTTQDRKAEADWLISQGNKQSDISQFEAALQSYQQALNIYREIKYRQGELWALGNLGNAYNSLSKYDQAIEFHLQSLEIAREIKDRQGEENLLGNLGNTYNSLGKYDQAIKFLLQALAIAREIKDRQGEGNSLGNLGIAYKNLGQYDKAIEYHLQDLVIAREIKDRQGEGKALGNLGNVYDSLGRYDKAIEYQRQHLAIAKEIKDRQGEGNALGNLGIAYYALSKYDKAIEYQLQRLAITREIKDRQSEGAALGNLGNTYDSLGKYDKAIEYQLQVLEITREIKARQIEGITLNNLASSYEKLNRDREAIISYQQALSIAREIGDRSGEGLALANLGRVLSKAKRPELAILFYKQSVNVIESIRQDLRKLDKDVQKSYLETVESTYRNLADLLLKQDRILEAQQVLDLLKVEELSEYLRTVSVNPETAKGADFQNSEKNIIALSNELAELQKLDREGKLDPQQQPRLAFLTNNEKEYNKQFNAFLQIPAVQKEIQELRRTQSAQNVDIQKYNRLRGNLSKLQNAALFYPLVLEDRLELILIIANAPPIRKTINLKRTDLNQAITSFLSNLRNPNSEVKPDAQKFYNWLIQPFEKELQQANIQTIIYAPDEGLRYIPLAALYDGKQWLVERYRINNITAASLTDFTPRTASSIRVLAAASTTKHDVKIGDRTLSFSALPATKLEVDNIATKINTTELIDRDFTESALTGKLNTHNIIHLATHGHFEVGQPEQSFILLGDGKISTISDIGSWTLTNVSLVVLSACETAIGGQGGKSKGIEIFGLGYQIHNAGASAAIATLWKVSDGGTERLMDAFYTAVKTGKVSNTEALRQAQVAMITGNYEGLGDARGIVSIEARPRATSSTVPAKISHPYYWAAFILIGNGM